MTTTQDPTKLPALPNVPADASPELRRYLEALGEILNIRTGRAGDPRDRAVTLRELLDSGLAVDLASAAFNPQTSGNPGFVAPGVQFVDLATPPQPTGVTATAGYQQIYINWTFPLYSNHAYTEVWRGDADVIGDAQLIGIQSARFYTDPVGANVTRYYWVRHVSNESVTGPYSASVTATTPQDVDFLLDALAGAITSSELATELSQPILRADDDATQVIPDPFFNFNSTDYWNLGTDWAWSATGGIDALGATVPGVVFTGDNSTVSSTARYLYPYTPVPNSVSAKLNHFKHVNGNKFRVKVRAKIDTDFNGVLNFNYRTLTRDSDGLPVANAGTFLNFNWEHNGSTDLIAAPTSDYAESHPKDRWNLYEGTLTVKTSGATDHGDDGTLYYDDLQAGANLASTSGKYVFSTTTPSSSGTTTWATITTAGGVDALFIHKEDAAGASQTSLLNSVVEDDTITWYQNSGKWVKFVVTGTPVFSDPTYRFDVSLVDHVDTSDTDPLSGLDGTNIELRFSPDAQASDKVWGSIYTVAKYHASVPTDDKVALSSFEVFQHDPTAIDVSLNNVEGQYTVKIDDGNNVTGFGLASSANDATPYSEFGVRADAFWIAGPTAVGTEPTAPYHGQAWNERGTIKYYNTLKEPSPDWQTTPVSVPFTVVTTGYDVTDAADETHTIPAGAYMDAAFIKKASIESAQIKQITADLITTGNLDVANLITTDQINVSKILVDGATITSSAGTLEVNALSITEAHIQDAEITTLKIQGNAVTVPIAQTFANCVVSSGSISGTVVNVGANVGTHDSGGNAVGGSYWLISELMGTDTGASSGTITSPATSPFNPVGGGYLINFTAYGSADDNDGRAIIRLRVKKGIGGAYTTVSEHKPGVRADSGVSNTWELPVTMCFSEATGITDDVYVQVEFEGSSGIVSFNSIILNIVGIKR